MNFKKKINVLTALPVIGQPRDAKRVFMLQQANCSVEVVTFIRDHHSGRIPDCSIETLGKINNGQYIRRLFKLVAAIPKMRNAIKRNDVTYASGADMGLLAVIAGIGLNRPVILEVGDIRRIQISSGIAGMLARAMDKFVISASKLLIVTAPGFVDSYYRKWLNSNIPAMILENKMDASLKENINVIINQREGIPISERPLRIGYFGVLRCKWSWQVLEALAEASPENIEIIVAGHVLEPSDLVECTEKYQNIAYRGEYRSPEDLPLLYGDVDIVWACYPPPAENDADWRWAQEICRSNRFYESCFFKKPIISVVESGDAIQVKKYGIGKIVTDQSVVAMVKEIKSITTQDLSAWRENLKKLPKEVYEYTTEVDELGNAISNIISL